MGTGLKAKIYAKAKYSPFIFPCSFHFYARAYTKPRLYRAAKIGLELVRLILSYNPQEDQKAELQTRRHRSLS